MAEILAFISTASLVVIAATLAGPKARDAVRRWRPRRRPFDVRYFVGVD